MTTEEMAVKLAETEARSKSNTHRIDRLEENTDAINRLATSVEVMVREQKHQTETIKEVKSDLSTLSEKVDTIEQKPAKRWDGIVDKIITAAAGAVITALVGALIYLLGVEP